MDDRIYNINDSDINYTLVTKEQNDIINDITYDPNERLIYESIISNLEASAANAIINNKIAQLPLIGCVRKNPIRQVVVSNHTNFSIARKQLSKEGYKDHVREIIIDAKQNLEKTERYKLLVKRTRSRNKKRYDQLYLKLGYAYAEMYIHSILMLKEVPFVLEVQEAFDRLNNI